MHQRPAGIIPRHHLHGGVRLEIELRGRGRAAMAADAIFRDKRTNGLRELLIQRRDRSSSGGEGSEGQKRNVNAKVPQFLPSYTPNSEPPRKVRAFFKVASLIELNFRFAGIDFQEINDHDVQETWNRCRDSRRDFDEPGRLRPAAGSYEACKLPRRRIQRRVLAKAVRKNSLPTRRTSRP